MKQSALTILTPIDPAAVNPLEALLTQLGADVAGQTTLPFEQLDLLHFASWVILHSDRHGPQLIFEANFDGDPAAFLDQLTTKASTGLEEIYASCPDYHSTGQPADLARCLRDHAVYTDTFYIGGTGLDRQRIRNEQNLREKIEAHLDTLPHGKHDAAQIRTAIQDFVRRDPALAWALQPAAKPSAVERVLFWTPPVIAALAFIALLVWTWWIGPAAIVGLLLLTVLILRWKEHSDPSISDEAFAEAKPDDDHVRHLVQHEDRRPQNHLSSLNIVKPGPFRYLLLKFVLWAIGLTARYIYNKGKLGGIPSIHFARWAMINRGEHLLFLSNFDGSWEHYLGEFIDQAAGGLTAVWSNCVGFPRTRWLIRDGARDEGKFKAYARRSQIPTQLWYSAYPFLSVSNVYNNAAIREQLWSDLTKDELQAWLRRF